MSKRREGNNINVLIDDEVNKLKNFDLEFAPKNSSSGTSGLFDETPKYKEYGIYDY